MKLPAWDVSRTIVFPVCTDWNERAMLMNEAMAQRMREKFGASHNADWASARELALAQEEAEASKRAEELKTQNETTTGRPSSVPSATRPYHENAMLTATSGRGTEGT